MVLVLIVIMDNYYIISRKRWYRSNGAESEQCLATYPIGNVIPEALQSEAIFYKNNTWKSPKSPPQFSEHSYLHLTVNTVLVSPMLRGLEISAGALVSDAIASFRVEGMCTAQRCEKLKRILVISLQLCT